MRMRYLDTKSSPHFSECLVSQSQFPAQLTGMQRFQENARVGVLKRRHGVRTKWSDVNLSVEVPASARTKEHPVLSQPGERGAQRPPAEAPAVRVAGHPAGNRAHLAPPAWGPSTGQVTVLEGLECCRKDPGPPPAPWAQLPRGVRLCDPMDCSPPGSSVHGILQARTLEWVAISSSRGFSRPRGRTHVSWGSCIGRRILYHWASWEASLGLRII